jgi:antitoxin component YwqK of YwqJK toxin-antitoxin module
LTKYITDELDGSFVQYNTNGTIKAKGEVRNNLKVNHWIINDEEGKPIEEVTYNNKQLREGNYTLFYPNGKIKKTGMYKIQLAKIKCIDPKTYRNTDCEIPKETERGKWIYYKENGEIQEEIDYK